MAPPIYTNEDASFNGAIFINRRLDNKETRVPAFDCRERNQCTGGDYTKLCQGPDPKPSFFIEPLGNNRFQLGKKDNLPASEIAARVWDIFTAQPTEPFYVGEKVEVQLQNPSGRIRLTAITTKGCFGISEQGLGQ